MSLSKLGDARYRAAAIFPASLAKDRRNEFHLRSDANVSPSRFPRQGTLLKVQLFMVAIAK